MGVVDAPRRRRHGGRRASAASTSACASSASTPRSRWPTTGRWSASGPRPRPARAELLPPGTAVRLERDVEARDRYGRLLAYVFRAERRRPRQPAPRRRRASPRPAVRAQRRPPGRAGRAEDDGPCRAPGPLAGRAAARTCRSARRPDDRAAGSVSAVTSARRAARVRPRRPAADRQLRRPRLLPRRQRRRLRGPARRASPPAPSLMVPCPWARDAAAALPRRGRRRAPHAQRRARALPVGPDHPRPVACSTATAASPAPSSDVWDHADLDEVRRELPGPDRAGDPLGLRREPPRQPHGHAAAAARVLRRLPRAGRRVRPARCACRRASSERVVGFPFRRLAAEEGVRVPRPLRARAGACGSPRTIERVARRASRPGVTEVYVHPAVDTPELRALADDWPARVDDHDLVTHDDRCADARPGRRAPHRLPAAPRPPARRVMRRALRAAPPCLVLVARRPGAASPSPARRPPRTSRRSTCRPDHTITVDDEGFDPAALE